MASDIEMLNFDGDNKVNVARQSVLAARLSPQEYVHAIAQHAGQDTHQSRYPGHNFEDLASLFQLPLERLPGHRRYLPKGLSLATLYILRSSSKTMAKPLEPSHCLQLLDREEDDQSSYLLFLKGNPSPAWMASIGSACQVDPEYFQRFASIHSRRDYFSSPSLPSTSENIITLPFTTIGARENKTNASDQKAVDKLRESAAAQMGIYTSCFKRDAEIGDSIVRRYNVHDERHFSLEQEISITVNSFRDKWVALISLDAGRDLVNGPHGPWLSGDQKQSWKTRLYPTIQHLPGIALRSQEVSLNGLPGPIGGLHQSASLLHENYGELLDHELMREDSFYALHDLFAFSAFSEVQFLNMMESILVSETDDTMLRHKPTLSNLLCSQSILESHRTKFQGLIKVIRRRGSPEWPKAGDLVRRNKAEEAAKRLDRDYEHLLQRICCLLDRCEKGMQVTMNNATIVQLQLTLAQGDQVAKLTMLAFFYLPFTFVTGFFGMQVVEFGAGKLELWLWFAVSCPVFVLSIIFLIFDVPAFFCRVIRWRKTTR